MLSNKSAINTVTTNSPNCTLNKSFEAWGIIDFNLAERCGDGSCGIKDAHGRDLSKPNCSKLNCTGLDPRLMDCAQPFRRRRATLRDCLYCEKNFAYIGPVIGLSPLLSAQVQARITITKSRASSRETSDTVNLGLPLSAARPGESIAQGTNAVPEPTLRESNSPRRWSYHIGPLANAPPTQTGNEGEKGRQTPRITPGPQPPAQEGDEARGDRSKEQTGPNGAQSKPLSDKPRGRTKDFKSGRAHNGYDAQLTRNGHASHLSRKQTDFSTSFLFQGHEGHPGGLFRYQSSAQASGSRGADGELQWFATDALPIPGESGSSGNADGDRSQYFGGWQGSKTAGSNLISISASGNEAEGRGHGGERTDIKTTTRGPSPSSVLKSNNDEGKAKKGNAVRAQIPLKIYIFAGFVIWQIQ
jgi:hypothetical protein